MLIVRLFAISCQSGRESRAAELVHRSTTGQGIQTMCSYASKKQRPRLSEKVDIKNNEEFDEGEYLGG